MKQIQEPHKNKQNLSLNKPSLLKTWLIFISKLKRRRITVGLLALLMMASFILVPANSVLAAVKYSGMKVPEKASVYESVLILEKCLVDQWVNTNEAQIKDGRVAQSPNAGAQWAVWDKPIIAYHQTLRDEDNIMNCSEYDDALIKGAIKRLQIDPIDFVCKMGGKRENGTSAANCTKATGNFSYPFPDGKITRDKLVKYLKDTVGIDRDNPGNEVRFWRSYNIVDNYCVGASITKAEWDKEDGNNRYNYEDPKTGNQVYFLANSLKDEKPKYKGTQQGDSTCRTYWERMKQYYPAYELYLSQLSDEDRQEEKDAQEDNQNATEDQAVPTTCAISGIGWIVCPVVDFFATLTDGLYGWIQNFLVVAPLNTNTGDENNTAYIAWTTMRNIANVAFVLAFIIIIYSQLTGAGVSNYGVKKLLPRLIVSAILVNASFWIAAIAVDISNIIGNNLYNFLRGGVPVGKFDLPSNVWESIGTALLAGGTVGLAATGGVAIVAAGAGAAVLTAAGLAFLVLILGVVLALIVAFLILAVRQALIIILIVISPLAFVAMLLPNTEKFFTLWRKTLTTLLIFYPLFSLLFGGSYLAGVIIIGSAGGAGDDSAIGLMVLVGLAVTVLPLWLTPLIMRFSGGVLGQVAGMVNNKSKGLIDRARKVRDRKAGLAMHETLGHRNNARNPFGRVYRRMQNSSQRDADRKKVIDSGNTANYMTSEAGSDMAYRTALGDSQVDAAKSYNDARFQETLSTSQAVAADHPQRAIIEAARQAREESNIAKGRIQSAQGVLQQEYAQQLADRPGLAQRAGGIDPRGQSRVVASAQAVINKAESDAVANEKVTMSQMNASELTSIMKDTSASIERRSAAAGQITKIGGDEDIYKALDYVGSLTPGEDTTALQQQLAADIGGRKPYSIGAADFANLGQGKYSGSFTQKVVSRIQGGKLSADTVINGGADELKQIIAAADGGHISRSDANYSQLKSQVNDYLVNPANKQPPKEILDLITRL